MLIVPAELPEAERTATAALASGQLPFPPHREGERAREFGDRATVALLALHYGTTPDGLNQLAEHYPELSAAVAALRADLAADPAEPGSTERRSQPDWCDRPESHSATTRTLSAVLPGHGG